MAAGVPECVVESLEAYELRIREFVGAPDRLRDIRRRLKENGMRDRPFDAGLFAASLQTAFTAAYQRFAQGLPPELIDLAGARH